MLRNLLTCHPAKRIAFATALISSVLFISILFLIDQGWFGRHLSREHQYFAIEFICGYLVLAGFVVRWCVFERAIACDSCDWAGGFIDVTHSGRVCPKCGSRFFKYAQLLDERTWTTRSYGSVHRRTKTTYHIRRGVTFEEIEMLWKIDGRITIMPHPKAIWRSPPLFWHLK